MKKGQKPLWKSHYNLEVMLIICEESLALFKEPLSSKRNTVLLIKKANYSSKIIILTSKILVTLSKSFVSLFYHLDDNNGYHNILIKKSDFLMRAWQILYRKVFFSLNWYNSREFVDKLKFISRHLCTLSFLSTFCTRQWYVQFMAAYAMVWIARSRSFNVFHY